MIEAPIGYRVWWDRFSLTAAPKGERHATSRDFPTREEAEAYKRAVKAQRGGQVVVCLQPVYVSRAKREKRHGAMQASAAAHWPLQVRTLE